MEPLIYLQIFLYIIPIVFKSTTVLGEQCFNCSSLIDERCRDPFIPLTEFIIVCPVGSECQKLMMKGEVTRYCTSVDGPRIKESSVYTKECFQKLLKITDTIPFYGTRTEEQFVTICNCESELCNKSQTVNALSLTCYAFLFVMIMLVC